MSTQLMSLVELCRSFAMSGRAGATSDCKTAKDRPPSDRNRTTRVVLAW